MELGPTFKLLYQYILDRCDSVGVWKPNTRLAEFFVSNGAEIDWDGFVGNMGDRLKVTDRGNYWLTKFCDFQYGKLSEDSTSKPILSYINLLKKHNLWKAYTKGMDTLKEKDKEKEKEEEKEKSLKDRELAFEANTLSDFEGKFPQDVLLAFIDYWGEPNKSKTKLRYELQPTWDTARRLKTWEKRGKEMKNKGGNSRNDSKYL